jgi:hypothetical protein
MISPPPMKLVPLRLPEAVPAVTFSLEKAPPISKPV